MPTRTVDRVEIKADRIVAALIDRLIANEKRIANLEAEVKANFESSCEEAPWLTPEGRIRFRRVLRNNGEPGAVAVEVTPSLITPEE